MKFIVVLLLFSFVFVKESIGQECGVSNIGYSTLTLTTCEYLVMMVENMVASNMTETEIENALEYYCDIYLPSDMAYVVRCYV